MSDKRAAKAKRSVSPVQASAAASTGHRRRDTSVLVAIVQQLGATPQRLLEVALERALFWDHLGQAHRASGREPGGLRIVIKPDLDIYGRAALGGTDPMLVEHLVDLLHDRGFTHVTVGDGRNATDGWLHNREPLVVPDLAGYRFETTRGRPYDIIELQGEAPGDVEESSAAVPIGRHWLEADFRIDFAKNKTHEEHGYALCVHNLAGVVAATRADGTPHRRSASEDCLSVLRRAPPHFSVIDAYRSCHGGAGQRAPAPMETHAVIASSDALLADWAGAAKMGLDPYVSPVNAKALRRVGLPASYRIDGDLGPYPLWRNVHPLIAQSARQRSRTGRLGEIAEPWFQRVDREHFPFRDFYSDRINSFLSPLMAELDDNPRSFLAVLLVNHVIATVGAAIEAQQTMFSKTRLERRIEPLEIDLAAYGRADFESIPADLAPCEQLVESLPANRMGLRWRHVDGAVLFSCSHVFPIAYEAFVGAVDITQAIRYLNDYIGGSTVAVRRDRRGRVVHQAERNLYLQQPNWMALFGGDLIDVEKLELVTYGRDRQSIFWRTVASPNDSASHDDGRVSFLRTGKDRTTVTIFARQQFSLPPLFRILDVDMAPGIRDPIIEAAYARFFTGTVANLQAAYEGREFRIGCEPDDTARPQGAGMPDLARYLATALAAGSELLRHRGDVADFGDWLFPAAPGKAPGPAPAEVDRHGFRHFAPAPTRSAGWRGDERATVAGMAALMRDAPDVLTGLADAVRRDLDRMASPTEDGTGR